MSNIYKTRVSTISITRFNMTNNLCKLVGILPFLAMILRHFNRGYLVLMYHSISNYHNKYRYNIGIKNFKEQIKYLSKNFCIIKTEEILAKIKNKIEPTDIEIAITFDDGYLNNFKYAYPYLKKLSIPATFFIAVNFIEGGFGKKTFSPMSWKQINEISSHDLFNIGSHTLTHPILPNLQNNKIKEELRRSKEIIEENIGKKINVISYPHGKYDKKVSEISEKTGYKMGFTNEKIINNNTTNPYKFGRYAITNRSIIKI